ncbi:MAG: HEAT repeat domain-containing protein [Planctomycetota bacterium]
MLLSIALTVLASSVDASAFQQGPPPKKYEVEVDETFSIPRTRVVHGDGELVLPRTRGVPQRAGSTAPQDPDARTAQNFAHGVSQLRRSLHLGQSRESATLDALAHEFDQLPERSLAMLRAADADIAYGALRVLARHGGAEHVRELEYLLLTRSFGSSTDAALETLALLAQEAANDRLFACLVSSRAPVRFHAERLLATRLRPEDLDRVLDLSRGSQGDVRIKSVRLLGAFPGEAKARERLVIALGEDSLVADAAVEALIAHGPDHVDDLRSILAQPANGRAFGYAAVVLAALADADPARMPWTEAMREPLLAEIDMPDPFQRCAVAMGLCDLAMASDDLGGDRYRDQAVLAALVDVAAPSVFIPHLSRLKGLALPRLVRFAGRDLGVSPLAWRQWFGEIATASASTTPFVGTRRAATIDATNASLVALHWRGSEVPLVLRGVDAPAQAPEQGFEFLLTDGDVTELVDALKTAGFMRPSQSTGERDPRSLELRIGAARVVTDPATPSVVLDRLAARLMTSARAQYWQLWRDPVAEPDEEAWWRAELRWRDANPDPAVRAARSRSRLIAALGREKGIRRRIAFDELVLLPKLRETLTVADGKALLAAVAADRSWDETSFRLVELAMVAPDESTWREAVEAARAADEQGLAKEPVLPRVFALLGPERLLECLEAASPAVRRVAMIEVGRLRDLRAAPILERIASADAETLELRMLAVRSLGALRAPQSRDVLIQALTRDGLDAGLRRTIWVALGQIGGPGVFDVLRRAMATPDESDRIALVRALGALRDPEAAYALAEVVVLRGDDALGSIALEMLRQQGDKLAAPAMRPHLKDADPTARRLFALALGEFQDPAALPEQFALLEDERSRLRAVSAIAATTGRDVFAENDRAAVLRAWWESQRGRTQGEWFLEALASAEVSTSLTAADLAPGMGALAVPELTRLAMELDPPHLRALAGRLLRVTTGEDFGVISPATPQTQRLAICDRYRLHVEAARAAAGK